MNECILNLNLGGKNNFFRQKLVFLASTQFFNGKKRFFRQLAQNLPTLLHVCLISCRITSFTTRGQGYTKKLSVIGGQYAVGPLAN